MKKDFCESLILFRRVKIVQIDASIRKRLIGRSEHREWTWPPERSNQIRMLQSSNKGVVNPRFGCVGWDVF